MWQWFTVNYIQLTVTDNWQLWLWFDYYSWQLTTDNYDTSYQSWELVHLIERLRLGRFARRSTCAQAWCRTAWMPWTSTRWLWASLRMTLADQSSSPPMSSTLTDLSHLWKKSPRMAMRMLTSRGTSSSHWFDSSMALTFLVFSAGAPGRFKCNLRERVHWPSQAWKMFLVFN